MNARRRLALLLLPLIIAIAVPAIVAAQSSTSSSHLTSSRTTRVTRARTEATRSRLSARTTQQSPSGEAMPTGNIPGWKEVFSDNFSGTKLNTKLWHTYYGQPGGDPSGWFSPSHVSVRDGMLVIGGSRDPAAGDRWATGGVSSSTGFSQTYGKYLVRFRMDAGVGIAPTILLWPADNRWPPEIDFSEDTGGNRLTDFATLHYGASNTMIQKRLSVNLTKWNTVGVEWTPGKLVYTINGRDWATVRSPAVPSGPMVLDIQSQAWGCSTNTWERCPNATTPPAVNLDVDWVVAYAPT